MGGVIGFEEFDSMIGARLGFRIRGEPRGEIRAVPSRIRENLPLPSGFADELASRLAGSAPRRGKIRQWVLVLPDQLNLGIGPLATADVKSTGVVLLESGEWLSRRPYHRQRLAWILLSQRMFALEAADRGLLVRYERSDEPMAAMLARVVRETGPLAVTDPAERETRAEFAALVAGGSLVCSPHDGFMTTGADLERSRGSEGWRMDRFYQGVRQRTGILMERGKPVGGKYSFDAENRKRWDGTPAAPTPPAFSGSLIREEIAEEIEGRFRAHPGTLDLDAIPGSQAEIERTWQWAKRACLPNFGPYEDAMSRRSRGVFHTRLSPLMNLHRLLPSRVVGEVAALELPLASKEGFIRQVLGWREFVYQVHRATDGFRSGVTGDESPLPTPGDGGFARWSGAPWKPIAPPPTGVDGGARPNRLKADLGVPPAWWGRESGLDCLDHVVSDVWAEGWSHHITRLMVLANIASLAGVSPRELCDWFWIAYIDAWDWVVEPNVLGMATYSAGEVMTTKPYVCGSAYVRKMGDFCDGCRFTPGSTCPITPMYWAFLSRHEASLRENPRMSLVMGSVRKRSAEQRRDDERVASIVRELLVHGKPITAEALR